ncbi:MAG: hypothetical protein S4CHLAM123_01190 [Chlamydiales bacterium]|nr:hypothetical protein [Chlamydiales bacterium]
MIAQIFFNPDLKNIISEKELIKLIKETKQSKESETINLQKLIVKKGFSACIADCFFDEADIFQNVNLSGITFVQCTFEWVRCSQLKLDTVTFQSCDLRNVSFMQSELKNCLFSNCKVQESMFVGSQLDEVTFEKSSLTGSSFEDTSIKESLFCNIDMAGTHFLQASIEHTQIEMSDLEDCVFFGTLNDFQIDDESAKTAVVTRLATAMLIDPNNPGISLPKVYLKLAQTAHMIPLRISSIPPKVVAETTALEVEKALKEINSDLPIPQQLLNIILENSELESFKVLEKARVLASEVESFFLPGSNEDIPPKIYGKEIEKGTQWEGDYRRVLLELGMIGQSMKKGIPLMGVCRGMQITNVYFGAQLLQYVPGHKGMQKIHLSSQQGHSLYAQAMKKPILSPSYHHQAVPISKAAVQHIEISSVYGDIVKASEIKYSSAAPMILLQFHPEFHHAPTARLIERELADLGIEILMSEKNEIFWKIFSDSAKVYRIKKVCLSIIKSKVSKIKPIITSIR